MNTSSNVLVSIAVLKAKAGKELALKQELLALAQVNPGVEDLADIAETRVPKGHVAKPERAEAQRLCSFGQCDLVEHARSVPIEGLQRKEESQAQMARSEGSAEPSMLLIRNRARPIHTHLPQWENVNSAPISRGAAASAAWERQVG